MKEDPAAMEIKKKEKEGDGGGEGEDGEGRQKRKSENVQSTGSSLVPRRSVPPSSCQEKNGRFSTPSEPQKRQSQKRFHRTNETR